VDKTHYGLNPQNHILDIYLYVYLLKRIHPLKKQDEVDDDVAGALNTQEAYSNKYSTIPENIIGTDLLFCGRNRISAKDG